MLGLFEHASGAREFESRGLKLPVSVTVPFAKYGVGGTPTVVIVDNSGKIDNFWVGELSPRALATVASILGPL